MIRVPLTSHGCDLLCQATNFLLLKMCHFGSTIFTTKFPLSLKMVVDCKLEVVITTRGLETQT